MKRIPSLLLAFVIVFGCFAGAEIIGTAKTYEYFDYHIENNYVVIDTINSGFEENLVIPNKIEGKYVRVINGPRENECLKSVVIPNSVRIIQNSSFSDCINLESISISENLKYIGADAFVNTAFYNNSDNWINGFLYLDNYLLKAKGKKLNYYKVKKGTTVVAVNAFERKITVLALPNSVKYITKYNLSTITQKYIVSSTNENYSVKSGVLYNKNKTKLIAYPALRKGKEFTVPKTVKTICENAFQSARYVRNVKMQYGLKTIKTGAFASTLNLRFVAIPYSISTIENSSFAGCEKLSSINFSGSQRKYYAIKNNEEKNSEFSVKRIVFNSVSPNTKIKKTKITSLVKDSYNAVVKYKSIKGIDGFELEYSTDKNFMKKVKSITDNATDNTRIIRDMDSKKTYYLRVRTYKYKKANNHKKKVRVFSYWSTVKKIKM